jgi:hypothetical protein
MLAGAGSVENALAHNSSGVVIPWIALGCGYRREFDPAVWETFDFGWNYDYIYSWMLGRELNGEWFAARPVRMQHFIICPPPPAFRFLVPSRSKQKGFNFNCCNRLHNSALPRGWAALLMLC